MGKLIVIFGAPGAGKSTLGKRLAARLKCPLIDKDFISDVFRENGMDEPNHRAIAYQVLYNCIPANLNSNGTVIIEAPLIKQFKTGERPAKLLELAREFKAELKFIYVFCSETVLKERIRKRGASRDAAKLTSDGWDRFVSEEVNWQFEATSDLDLLKLNTETEMTSQLNESLKFINKSKKPQSTFSQAWEKTFAWKPVLERGKHGDTSLVLLGAAIVFYLSRFLSPIQYFKLLFRATGPEAVNRSLHPALSEVFAVVPCMVSIGIFICLANNIVLFEVQYLVFMLLIGMRALDLIVGNSYYLMLRPIVERDVPQNEYRSFLLGCIGFAELCVLLSLGWYLIGYYYGTPTAIMQILSNILSGDSGIEKLREKTPVYDLFAKISLGVMLTIIIGRAISLVPPLPPRQRSAT